MKMKMVGIVFTVFVYVPLLATAGLALNGLGGNPVGKAYATAKTVAETGVCKHDKNTCGSCGDIKEMPGHCAV